MPARRAFLLQAAASVAALRWGASFLQAATAAGDWSIAIFEKVFEGLSYEELADALAQVGADGVEATIRPGGHIEPETATDEVPKMVEALQQRGLAILIAATHIRSADQPHTESLLRTLKSAGIAYYRLGHLELNHSYPLLTQVDRYATQMRELAALNRQIGICGLYQNHSGAKYLGALGWDAAMMLRGIDPKDLGIALDTRHLVKDTGSSWPTALAACKPHIRSIYLKDGTWYGPRGDQYKDVPLDTGFVNEEVFEAIRAGLPPMPLCIHMEWLGYRVFEKHEIPQAIAAHQRDIATVRRWLRR